MSDLSRKFDTVFDTFIAGKTPNLALMYEIKEILSDLGTNKSEADIAADQRKSDE